MATVTDTGISLVNAMDSTTVTNVPTGGGGASQNTDLFLQGSASYAKRLSGVTDVGFAADQGSGQNYTGLHIGIWVFYVHYSALTAMKGILCVDTSNYGRFNVFDNSGNFPYPTLGGWARLWVDADKTPNTNVGTPGYDKTSVRYVGFQVSVPSVGSGSAANAFLDAIHSTNSSTGGLLLTGTSGKWDDFLANDERGGGTNGGRFGIVSSRGGVIYCQGRLKLGSASSLVFSDSNFAIVFPNQQACSSTFMGISVDLQHASTAITFTNGSLSSPGATTKGDFIVTGTAGSLTANGFIVSGLRIVTLTNKCTITGGNFVGCGQITSGGASLLGAKISGYTGAADTSSIIWNQAVDPDGKLDGMTFTKGTNAHHAVEFGTSSPLSMTLRNMTFSGFTNAVGNNAAPLHIKRTNAQETVNISASGCTGITASGYKSDGAQVVITLDTRTVKVSVVDSGGSAVTGSNVFLKASSGGPFPYQAGVGIERSGSTATVSHSGHGLANGDKVLIEGADQPEYNGAFTISNVSAGAYDYTVSGSPATPATGAIKSTFVFLKGNADQGTGSNEISMSRAIPSSQPVVGWARKSTGSPLYKPGSVAGSVSSTGDTSFSAVMISDD